MKIWKELVVGGLIFAIIAGLAVEFIVRGVDAGVPGSMPTETPTIAPQPSDWKPISIDLVKATEYGVAVTEHYWPDPTQGLNPSSYNWTLFLYRSLDREFVDGTTYDRISCMMAVVVPDDPYELPSESRPQGWDRPLDFRDILSSSAWEIAGPEGNVVEFLLFTKSALRNDPVCNKENVVVLPSPFMAANKFAVIRTRIEGGDSPENYP